MGDRLRPTSIEDLPSHLILEILSRARLSAVDLVSLELTSRTFGSSHGLYPHKFRSLIELVAFQHCESHPVFLLLSFNSKKELFDRCSGNWKRVLRFLQSLEQSSGMTETSSGNMQVTAGTYYTLLLQDSSVYSCGSSLCGVLGHGAGRKQCAAFTPISFPYPTHISQVSASHNHAAFVTESGEVFTCGDNSSNCCGHGETVRTIFRPRLLEALKGVPCKQVAAGLNFTVFLTKEGNIYTCGNNVYGQLGHGDSLERPIPQMIEHLVAVGAVMQIAAGPSYVLAVLQNGGLYSFGSGNNFCLGHGEQHNEFQPRLIQSFRRKGIHVVRVSAGDEHAVALDSNGLVYTWGKGYCGALGHGDEIDKTTPELVDSLKSHLAVQVCARKRKTFVLDEHGYVYSFGWMGYHSLGFPDRGVSDKVMRPRVLDCLKKHRISQISTGLYHTVAITSKGRIFGFGDNERWQLGHDMLRGCPEPTEIFVQRRGDETVGSGSETECSSGSDY